MSEEGSLTDTETPATEKAAVLASDLEAGPGTRARGEETLEKKLPTSGISSSGTELLPGPRYGFSKGCVTLLEPSEGC